MGYAPYLSEAGAAATMDAARPRQWRLPRLLALCLARQGPAAETRHGRTDARPFPALQRRRHLSRRYAQDHPSVSQIFYLNSVSSRRRKAASAEMYGSWRATLQ